MKINVTKYFPSILGFYIVCVLLFDDSPTMYLFNNAIFVGITFLIIMKRRYTIKIDWFTLFLILYTIWLCLSIIWCIDSNAVIEDVRQHISFLVLFFVVTQMVQSVETFRVVFNWFMIAGVAYFICLMSIYGLQFYISQIVEGNRIGGELLQLNKLAMNCVIIFLVAFNVFLEYRKKYCFVPMILTLFISIGAESRRAFLVLVIGIILSYIIYIIGIRSGNKKLIRILTGVLVAIFVTEVVSNSSLFMNISDRFSELTGQGRENLVRMRFINYGIQSFLENPVLGIGSGNSYIVTLQAAGRSTYLHNNYIELLVNLGVVGFFLYYFLYAILLKGLIKLWKCDLESRVLIVILVGQLVSDIAITSYSSKFTYIIFGLAYALIKQKKKYLVENQKKFNKL